MAPSTLPFGQAQDEGRSALGDTNTPGPELAGGGAGLSKDVRPVRLHETVVARLRDRIVEGDIAPSARLSEERWRQAVAEHEAILAALQARDGRRLAELLDTHLRDKGAVVAALVPAANGKESGPAAPCAMVGQLREEPP
jgi:hypothetical protein